MMDKGWRTSEFYLALGTATASLLVSLGLGDAAESVRAVFAAAAVVVPALYGLFRTLLKRKVVAAAQVVVNAPAE